MTTTSKSLWSRPKKKKKGKGKHENLLPCRVRVGVRVSVAESTKRRLMEIRNTVKFWGEVFCCAFGIFYDFYDFFSLLTERSRTCRATPFVMGRSVATVGHLHKLINSQWGKRWKLCNCQPIRSQSHSLLTVGNQAKMNAGNCQRIGNRFMSFNCQHPPGNNSNNSSNNNNGDPQQTQNMSTAIAVGGQLKPFQAAYQRSQSQQQQQQQLSKTLKRSEKNANKFLTRHYTNANFIKRRCDQAVLWDHRMDFNCQVIDLKYSPSCCQLVFGLIKRSAGR